LFNVADAPVESIREDKVEFVLEISFLRECEAEPRASLVPKTPAKLPPVVLIEYIDFPSEQSSPPWLVTAEIGTL
jgi:hypothetical protein